MKKRDRIRAILAHIDSETWAAEWDAAHALVRLEIDQLHVDSWKIEYDEGGES